MARVSVILILAILKLPVLKGAAKSRISFENNIANDITSEVTVGYINMINGYIPVYISLLLYTWICCELFR